MSETAGLPWWMAVDREELREAAISAITTPMTLLLHGQAWEDGTSEGLDLIAHTLETAGHRVIREPATRPRSLRERLLSTLRQVSEADAHQVSPAAIFANASTTDIVDAIARRCRDSTDKFALILEDVDRPGALKRLDLAHLTELRRSARMTIAASYVNKLSLSLPDRTKVLAMTEFTSKDVLSSLEAVPFGQDHLARSVHASLFAGADRVKPGLAYAALRTVAG